jgi:hypothetical protein
VLGDSAELVNLNNMRELSVPQPQYLVSSPNGKLAPEQGFEP